MASQFDTFGTIWLSMVKKILLCGYMETEQFLKPVSSRLISIRLRAAPFNITIIQVYAPTSGHDDSEVDHFYQQLQETIDKTQKKDILVVQGDWNAQNGKDAQADWGEVCGPYCNVETNERGLRLLEFATFNNLVLTNTLGRHKPSRRWTWHSPDGKIPQPD